MRWNPKAKGITKKFAAGQDKGGGNNEKKEKNVFFMCYVASYNLWELFQF